MLGKQKTKPTPAPPKHTERQNKTKNCKVKLYVGWATTPKHDTCPGVVDIPRVHSTKENSFSTFQHVYKIFVNFKIVVRFLFFH